MKIAICLSGHMRKFNETFPSFKEHLISEHDCDVFIHSWDKMGYHSAYKLDSTEDLTEKYVPALRALYKPKKMVIEDSGFVDELKRQGDLYAPHLRSVPKHVGHMASMFYKIYAANELRKRHELETNTKYDWVVRCRPDLIFHGKTIFPKEQIANAIYLPRHLCGNNWLTDQFAIAKPDEMDLYSSFFFHMKEYFSAQKEYRPEVFMDWNLKKKNLTPQMLDLHFSILR